MFVFQKLGVVFGVMPLPVQPRRGLGRAGAARACSAFAVQRAAVAAACSTLQHSATCHQGCYDEAHEVLTQVHHPAVQQIIRQLPPRVAVNSLRHALAGTQSEPEFPRYRRFTPFLPPYIHLLYQSPDRARPPRHVAMHVIQPYHITVNPPALPAAAKIAARLIFVVFD
jgi:hypothetical protein